MPRVVKPAAPPVPPEKDVLYAEWKTKLAAVEALEATLVTDKNKVKDTLALIETARAEEVVAQEAFLTAMGKRRNPDGSVGKGR